MGNDACRYAAQENRLEILKYLHEIGYELGEYICINAAINGNLEML